MIIIKKGKEKIVEILRDKLKDVVYRKKEFIRASKGTPNYKWGLLDGKAIAYEEAIKIVKRYYKN